MQEESLNRYAAVLFDFDGVLCHDRFYESAMADEYPDACIWIEKNIFTDGELMGKWMRGKLSSPDVNQRIATATGLDAALLDRKLDESARQMSLNRRCLLLIEKLKSKGLKTGIVSDNMDVFTRVIVPTNGLARYFDVIINSADYGLLKQDLDGALFDIAAKNIGVPVARTLLIDDSPGDIEVFNKKGGEGILF